MNLCKANECKQANDANHRHAIQSKRICAKQSKRMQTSNRNGDISPVSGQYQISINSKRIYTNIYNIKGRVSAIAIAIAQDGNCECDRRSDLDHFTIQYAEKDFNDKTSGYEPRPMEKEKLM